MTDKEKAKEIAEETGYFGERNGDFEERYQACIKMAAWKEQQITEKAVKWWENELTYPTMSAVEIDWLLTKIVAFRKAMEE